MTKAEGSPRIDGVEVLEVTLNVLGPSAVLTAKYALCNTDDSTRFGAGNRNSNWSAETLQCVKTLLDSMEKDVCIDLFGEGATTASVAPVAGTTSDGVPGM